MNVRTLCLAILNKADATGYEIRKLSTEAEYSYFVDASFGSIYPALNKLERDGMVTCRMKVQKGKPARKIYSITDQGREEFVEALKIPPQKDLFKSEFLLLAMNARLMSRDTMKIAIEKRLGQLREELAIIEAAGQFGDNSGLCWISQYGSTCCQASLDFLINNQDALLNMCETDIYHSAAAE